MNTGHIDPKIEAMGVRLLSPNEKNAAQIAHATIAASIPAGMSSIVVVHYALRFHRRPDIVAPRALIAVVVDGRVLSVITLRTTALAPLGAALIEVSKAIAFENDENERRRL